MPITGTAPYAPASGVILAVGRYRETGFGGGTIDPGLVMKLGLGEEVARRVVLSLKQLELLDEDGNPTDSLVALKRAPSGDFQQAMASHLFDIYAPVFAILGKDLSDKTSVQIEDAFRDFRPDSLRRRMVTCFLGLCEYAGIVEGSPKGQRGPKVGAPRRAAPKVPKVSPAPAPPVAPVIAPPAANGVATTRSVTLGSGGEVSMTVSVDLFSLSDADRRFVLDLVDKLKNYDGTPPALPPAPSEEV